MIYFHNIHSHNRELFSRIFIVKKNQADKLTKMQNDLKETHYFLKKKNSISSFKRIFFPKCCYQNEAASEANYFRSLSLVLVFYTIKFHPQLNIHLKE